jgi:hypothetical protein
LQEIIKEYPLYFDGKSPYAEAESSDCDDEEKTDKHSHPKRKKKHVFLIYFGGALQRMTPREYLKNLGLLGITDEAKKKNTKLIKLVVQNFDNETVSHRALIKFLREAMPDAVPLGSGFPARPARTRHCASMLNAMRDRSEIHDMEVEYLMKAIRDILRRSNIGQIHYGFLNPASPKGVPLPKADVLREVDGVNGTSGQVFYTYDHFELMVFNTELLEHAQKNEDGTITASVIHADSLARVTEVEVLPISNMHSDLAKDIAESTGNGVIVVPCVLQPEHSRMCGVCACVNLLLFSQCSMEWLLKSDCIENLLLKYGLPQRTSWTPENWATAGAVLGNCYVQGPQSDATVSSILTEIANAINSAEPFEVEGVDKNTEKRPKKKRKLTQRNLEDMLD